MQVAEPFEQLKTVYLTVQFGHDSLIFTVLSKQTYKRAWHVLHNDVRVEFLNGVMIYFALFHRIAVQHSNDIAVADGRHQLHLPGLVLVIVNDGLDSYGLSSRSLSLC